MPFSLQKSDDHEPTYTHYDDDDDDFLDDTFDMSKNDTIISQNHTESKFPTRCRALYDFQVSLYTRTCSSEVSGISLAI